MTSTVLDFENNALSKEEVLDQLQTMTEKQLLFLLQLSQKLFFDTSVN